MLPIPPSLGGANSAAEASPFSNRAQSVSRPKLLVSVRDASEAESIAAMHLDWLDLKDPDAGPLGRPTLNAVKAFMQVVTNACQHPSGPRHWSIAGGELLDWKTDEHAAWLHAIGPAGCIKWALADCAARADWIAVAARAAQPLPHASQQAILVHYADGWRCQAPDWQSVLDATQHLGWHRVLIDTAIKDGSSLLDHTSLETLESMLAQAKRAQIEVALAGALRLEMLEPLKMLNPAWLGFRSALCEHRDRRSTLIPERVLTAQRALQSLASLESLEESS